MLLMKFGYVITISYLLYNNMIPSSNTTLYRLV